MKVIRKIIEIDEELCDGCGLCVPSCAEGSLEIIDGKAKVIADNLCDGLGACLGECPNNALRIIEREAEEFDEEAVEQYLAEKEANAPSEAKAPAGGCPSAMAKTFPTMTPCQSANKPAAIEGTQQSALGHWPIQIHLIPPTAPFLKNADLLVLADCVPVAFPSLHRDFLAGKTVMMGCPKLDEVQAYIDKFAQIFQANSIKRITAVVMEVPCCAGLPVIVQKGLKAANKHIPMEIAVISTRGALLERRSIET